ncbi:unnamed protein product [Somion occarium]|uniref:Uncharacterized protein n=1 Tax=Somion occarium TaxID=3059160 RepID=A0ABP1E4Y6_9APHY
MDQDSFRQLLQSGGSAASSRNVQPTATSKGKAKKADSSQPAFKPRTIKKSAASNYRDRASERRHGLASDYAQVEALAEDFERRAAEAADALAKKTLEEQRWRKLPVTRLLRISSQSLAAKTRMRSRRLL